MPVYEVFEGIKINVFSNDHVPPHIHAQFGEFEALITIREQHLMAGYLPKAKLKKASRYVADHQDELLMLFYALNPQIRPL